MSKSIIIKSPLPGEAVDKHLKIFGHLPITNKCNERGECESFVHDLNWDRKEIGKTWCVRCGNKDVKDNEICEWSVKNVNP